MPTSNTGSLLREKAIAHKALGPTSAPAITFGNYFKLQLVFWIALLCVAAYLLIKTSYKETVSAKGVLEPIQHTQKIVSPSAARVEQIHVNRGEEVHRGTILASLSTGIYNEQGVSVLQENIRQLRVDRGLLEEKAELQRLAQEQSSQWKTVAAENVYRNKLSLEKEAALLATRIQLSDRNLEAISTLLNSGNSSTREYDQQHQVHLELLGRMQSLSQRLLQYEYELDALNNAQQLAELDQQQAKVEVQRELRSIDQRIARIENQALFTVVAQGEGVVAEVALENGKSVLPNQPLFFIDPTNTELQATVYVPAAIQAKLVEGQLVLLRYDGFDYRLYGRREATVATVGKVGLDPRENMLPFIGINEPVFKVTATLHESMVLRESPYQLQSGATLEADFVLAEMSLLQFILKPVLSLRGKVT